MTASIANWVATSASSGRVHKVATSASSEHVHKVPTIVLVPDMSQGRH